MEKKQFSLEDKDTDTKPKSAIDKLTIQLLLAAADALPNGLIAYKLGQYAAIDILRMLDYLLVSKSNLKEGLNEWACFLPLLDTPISVKIISDSHQAQLLFNNCKVCPDWLYYLLLALHVRLMEIYPEPLWHLTSGRAKLHWSSPILLRKSLPLHHSNNQVIFTLPLSMLDAAYPHQPPNISDVLPKFLKNLKSDSFGKFGSVDSLKRLLRIRLPEVPTMLSIAQEEYKSPRTLQRKLSSQGYSYSRLVGEVRHAEALHLLAATNLSLTEIAHRLGFSEASSLQRAFVKWQGTTPGQYRLRLREHDNPATQEVPIRLFYAENHMWEQYGFLRRTARVWLLITNLGFQKSVQVCCKDMDGLFREYPAQFECFIKPGLELWSTTNLPVAEPLHFILQMEVGGAKYIDNNNGIGYSLGHHDGVLLGDVEIVHPQSTLVQKADGQTDLIGSVYTPDVEGARLWLEPLTGDFGRKALLRKGCNQLGCCFWQLSVDNVTSDFHYSLRLEIPGKESVVESNFSAIFF